MADLTMGQRISEQRKKLGLSHEALGEQMGVSRQAISKWEADAAVPEIDKLIALSKLFGVSVGWLLGVEETTPQAAPETLSDKQLELVEQIMKKYQPRPITGKSRLILFVFTAALAVLAVMTLAVIRRSNYLQGVANAEALEALRSETNTQLAELHSRIDSLSTSQTLTPAEALLADYNLEIAGIVSGDQPSAEISFSAVPDTWQEGDSAFLSIRRDGAATVTQACTWDGAFLTARMFLEVADGYELCLTLTHADGTQGQQVLNDPCIQKLKQSLNITAELTSGRWDYDGDTLALKNYEFYFSMPLSGKFYKNLLWEQIDLVLTTGSGEELGRYNLLNAANGEDSDVLASPDIWMEHALIRFVNLQLPKEEEILLWVSVETNKGLSAMVPAAAWATDAAGKLRTQ